jgi:acetyl-CoA synthetase
LTRCARSAAALRTAVAHVALYRLGAVAMPLSMLFGPDALEYRINDSEARLAIVDERHRQRARGAALCAQLATVVAVGAAGGRATATGTTSSPRARLHAAKRLAPTTRRC